MKGPGVAVGPQDAEDVTASMVSVSNVGSDTHSAGHGSELAFVRAHSNSWGQVVQYRRAFIGQAIRVQ